MTPFCAVYGRDATTIHDYNDSSTKTASIDSSLIEHKKLLAKLKYSLEQAREIMASQANKHCLSKDFNMGDWVYLRLQKHRHTSIDKRLHHKLSKRFLGPYKVLEKICKFAYRLALPPTSKIHPIFHVSLLKESYDTVGSDDLPPDMTNAISEDVYFPEAILNKRKSSECHTEVLIKWCDKDISEATWEDMDEFYLQYPTFESNLEYEVICGEGSVETGRSPTNPT
ncbi:uncharacterized protein LOC143598971 [Bidens hawaiensis]|uniref:uncharacterized protein LOC143598971 n=1 Tax=Bidens hawaiensis TaxID=980011 RepID=UPI00404A4CE0